MPEPFSPQTSCLLASQIECSEKPSIGAFVLHKVCQSMDFKAEKLQKGSSFPNLNIFGLKGILGCRPQGPNFPSP